MTVISYIPYVRDGNIVTMLFAVRGQVNYQLRGIKTAPSWLAV